MQIISITRRAIVAASVMSVSPLLVGHTRADEDRRSIEAQLADLEARCWMVQPGE
jgi:hypothetical protein